ncbi:MAG: 50S ribosomal protein L18 [Candidatus Diapherotrites archaeon]|nr:50S ribosomal protein L18 [Candidatus Diapherotrites archaeon]
MATNATYALKFSRRRQKKTNYKKRLAQVKSNKPRFVVRITANNVSAQFIEYKVEGDVVLAVAHSKNLVKLGWKGHTGNTSSAYLTGYLAGLRAKKSKVKEAIFDLGLRSPTKGAAFYAVLKGALDAGVEIPVGNEEIMPTEDKITGKILADYASSLDKKELETKFSGYVKRGLDVSKLPEHFLETKKKLEQSASKEGEKK